MDNEQSNYRNTYMLDNFLRLPRRAQELVFNIIFDYKKCGEQNPASAFMVTGLDSSVCKSPIEQIFNVAFDITTFKNYDYDCRFGVELYPQYRISVNNKNYCVDFLFDSELLEDCEKEIKPYKLVIECDGHNYHQKNKQQVANDNERDYNLKSAGYDVLHFSGSQIYKNPLGCAEQAYNYIIKKLEV